MKPGVIRTMKGNVKMLAALKAVLRSGYPVKLNAFQRQQPPYYGDDCVNEVSLRKIEEN